MKTDICIARETKLQKIETVAKKIGIKGDDLFLHGDYACKLKNSNFDNVKIKKSKLILVTAINPTKAGEGKTTVSIGLADALNKLNVKVALALREPSLGPVFGVKGGAAGGGYAQIAPMDDINLHFTGDLHAISSANNLLSAMIDNHIYWGNELKIKTVTFKRTMDMNDRALRSIMCGIGYNERADGFNITAASEVMAVLCLAKDEKDLLCRLGQIVIGQDENGGNVTAKDLKADGAMAVVLKDAIKPNLVQTLEGTPCFVHGGPFANIAHGCNSIIATKLAMNYADYTVTEAGFGADLGAQKFLDIKCREAGLTPSAVVVVATIRALKSSGGKESDLGSEDLDALKNGFSNLQKHIENIASVYNLPCVVGINKFFSDTDAEIAFVKDECAKLGVAVEMISSFADGGKGGTDLAKAVIKAVAQKTEFKFSFSLDDSLDTKIEKVATKIYGADGVEFSDKASKALEFFKNSKYSQLPICIAKTQYSLSDNPKLLGRPSNFKITVRDIELRAGAGFFVVVAGDILLMPGLSKTPNAENIKITDGIIEGLF